MSKGVGSSRSSLRPDSIRKRQADHQYEVICKYRVTSVNTNDQAKLFLCELDYAGVFHIEGVPEEQMHPFLMIECPRMLFPFVRQSRSGPG